MIVALLGLIAFVLFFLHKRMEENGNPSYDELSAFLAWGAGALTALVSWVFCVSQYGYLLGFGLGWIPSAIVGAIVWGVVRYAWPYLLGAACVAAMMTLAHL